MLLSLSYRRCFILVAMGLTVASLTLAPKVHADYVFQTVTLDQSNALNNGVNYGSVLIEAYDGGVGGGGLSTGQVRLTFTASNASNYTSLGKTFGIGEVAFNTDLALTAGQISGPGGWTLSNTKSISGFGKFSWDLSGSAAGGSRPNPVSVTISGLGANATLQHFLFGSAGDGVNPPPLGSVDFAMFVAGFTTTDPTIGGHFVGGPFGVPPPGGQGEPPAATPEPSTLVLGGIGLVVFMGWSSRRRRHQAAHSHFGPTASARIAK